MQRQFALALLPAAFALAAVAPADRVRRPPHVRSTPRPCAGSAAPRFALQPGVDPSIFKSTPPPEAYLYTPPPDEVMTPPPDLPAMPPEAYATPPPEIYGSSGRPCAPAGPQSPLPLPSPGDCLEKIMELLGGTQAVREYVPLIIATARANGVSDAASLSYILATAEHESDHFATLYEYGSRSYFNRYDGMLGNTHPGDGYRYRGRGFVQITGRANYSKFSKLLGIDLVNNPDLAADPTIAAKILVIGMRDGDFTGVGLSDYFSSGKMDFLNARKIVNGMDQAGLIAGYAFQIYPYVKECSA